MGGTKTQEFIRKYRWLIGSMVVMFILANTAVFAFMVQVAFILFGVFIPYWVVFVTSVIYVSVLAIIIRVNE